MNRIEYSKNVIGQTLIPVSGLSVAGSAESSPRYAINVAGTNEPLCEIIEYVRGVAGTSEQDDVPPHPAPVEDLQLDAFFHRNELYGMRRGVAPDRRFTLGESKRR